MKYDKQITVNLGNYESLKVGVSDAPSFEECDKILIAELKSRGVFVDKKIRTALGWLER